ncbi:hypothetical protein GGR50DRAFT_635685 [Xylaria sp. CBS 124048]|nr:hypothetical protein GGR50DRAFT_635685 [Xylaria sp. CBS 124048]
MMSTLLRLYLALISCLWLRIGATWLATDRPKPVMKKSMIVEEHNAITRITSHPSQSLRLGPGAQPETPCHRHCFLCLFSFPS